MKMKLIAAAVAAIAANSAFAVDLAASQAAISAGRVIYATGASAPTKIVYNAFRNLCVAGTVHVFTAENVSANVTPGDSKWKNFGAYSCTLASSDAYTGAWAGENVVFMHSVDGGSINSVYGLSDDVAQRPKTLNGLSGCVATTLKTDKNDLVYKSCTVTTATTSPRGEGGFSDVEKEMFNALFTSNPPAGIDLADVAVAQVGAGQGFGVAVSKPLYLALQVQQGISAACQVDNAVNLKDPACMPTINKRDYASIVNGDPFSPTKNEWSFLLPGNTAKVNLCRRVDTSGTQASSNIYFLGNPCAGYEDKAGKRYPAAAIDTSSTFNVYEAPGTGDVKKCLSGTAGGTNAASLSIGVISAENNPTVPASVDDNWRFVKLDGVNIYDGAGNREAAKTGKYDFAFELVLHTHSTHTKPESAEVFASMITAMSDPTMPAIDGLFRLSDAKGTRGGNSCAPFAY